MNLMPQIIILMNYWVSICPGSGKMCLVFLASYPMKFLIKCHTFSGQHHGEIQKGQVSCETPINLSSVLESDSCLTSLLCFLSFLNKKHTLCFLIWEIEPSLRTLTSPPPSGNFLAGKNLPFTYFLSPKLLQQWWRNPNQEPENPAVQNLKEHTGGWLVVWYPEHREIW